MIGDTSELGSLSQQSMENRKHPTWNGLTKSLNDFQMVSNASTNLEVISEIVEAMDADVYGIVKEVIAYHDITIDANDVIESNDVS